MKREELKDAIETLLRCGIHKVQVPDSDIEFTSENLTVWIEQNLFSEWICSWCGEKFQKVDGVDKPTEHIIKCKNNPLLNEIDQLEGKVKVLNGINTTLSEGLGNAVEDYIKVEAKNKELMTSRDYWASVCKEAQEQRDLNAVWLEQAESRNKALVEGIKEFLKAYEPYHRPKSESVMHIMLAQYFDKFQKLLKE